METIYEVDSEDEAGDYQVKEAKPDPPFPPLLYVPSPDDPFFYIRSFKHPLTVLNLNPDRYPARNSNMRPLQHTHFKPDFYFPAWETLPAGFDIPFRDRPPGIFIKLTHDPYLVNVDGDPPPPPSPRSAKQRALRSSEIMEQVFSNLDMVTLLVSVQRVNRTWKRVVDESVALQRKLYLLPDENAPLGPHPQEGCEWNKDQKREEAFPVLNTLLVRYFQSSFFSFGNLYGHPRRSDSFLEMRWTAKRNKLKKSRRRQGRRRYRSVPPGLSKGEALQASQDRDRFTRAGASWRRMLVAQPPIPDFTVMMFSPICDKPSPEKLELALIDANHPDGGLRMGQLYDFVQNWASNHPLDSLWYRVVWFEPQGPFASDLSEGGTKAAFEETGCVVEMIHRKDDSAAAENQNLSTSGPNPTDPEAFDAIFKCDEFEAQCWQPHAMAVDYKSATHRSLGTLVD
ncbi:hypothetical protein ACHAQJ_009547 [Trichoderma viride]